MSARPPRRPVVRWHGGKWLLAPWIIAHFPSHRVYVEPFGGGGSVLLRKPRAYAEIYNDLDDWIVNLFRVLRDPPSAARLVELLRLTPFSRIEFEASGAPSDDPVEMARRLVVRSFMGFGSNAHAASPHTRSGFRAITRGINRGFRSTGFRGTSNRSGTTPAHDWMNFPEGLGAVVARLRGVVIEHRAACEVMAQHDSADTLHYVDPPYLPETRAPGNKYDLKHRMYRHELSRDDHVTLLAFLRGLAGHVVLSGYPAALYDETLADWRRIERRAMADGARARTEVLWLNPRCAAAMPQAPLFAEHAA